MNEIIYFGLGVLATLITEIMLYGVYELIKDYIDNKIEKLKECGK